MKLKHPFLTSTFAAIVAASLNAQEPPKAPETPKPPRAPRSVTVYSTSAAGRSYLGVDISEVTSERVASLKLKEERGVEIVSVDQDAPAAKAGLKEHDVILEFDGTKVEGEEQLRRMLRETPPGRTITLGISRDGQPMNVKVQLADRKKMVTVMPRNRTWAYVPEIPAMPEIHVPEINIPAFEYNGFARTYSSTTGVMVESLTPQLGDFFGVKNGEGVLIRSVEKGSAADAAGLRAGDVIVKFEDRKIADQTDWRSALRSRKTGKVTVTVVRDKREQTLSLNLPQPRHTEDSSSFELPSFEDLDNGMAEATIAFNRSRPEFERALREAQKTTQKNLEEYRKNWNSHRKEMQKAMEEFHKAMEHLGDDWN